jgi:hypothetical protein
MERVGIHPSVGKGQRSEVTCPENWTKRSKSYFSVYKRGII